MADVEAISEASCNTPSKGDVDRRRANMEKHGVLDIPILTKTAVDHNIKPMHVINLVHTLIHHTSIVTMEDLIEKLPDMPKAFKELLRNEFVVTTSEIIEKNDSKDGSTMKLLVKLHDGHQVETVIMRYGDDDFVKPDEPDSIKQPKENNLVQYVARESRARHGLEQGVNAKTTKKRSTVCVSSQVGCKMACSFCATGTMGLLENLTCGEILEQLFHATRQEPIRNLVFMGMGEPLDNYSEVTQAVQAITNPRFFSLSPTHVTLSTVGLHNEIRGLIKDCPKVNLAFSLHAPTQELREFIVSTSRKYHLNDIMAACNEFVLAQRSGDSKAAKQSGLLLQYCLIQGVNDSIEIAHQVADLIEEWPGMKKYARLNIIPYNFTETPMATKHDFKAPRKEDVLEFYSVLKERGISVFVRQLNGDDIAGACGQLVVDRKKQKLSVKTTKSELSVTQTDSAEHLNHEQSSWWYDGLLNQASAALNSVMKVYEENTDECHIAAGALLLSTIVTYSVVKSGRH